MNIRTVAIWLCVLAWPLFAHAQSTALQDYYARLQVAEQALTQSGAKSGSLPAPEAPAVQALIKTMLDGRAVLDTVSLGEDEMADASQIAIEIRTIQDAYAYDGLPLSMDEASKRIGADRAQGLLVMARENARRYQDVIVAGIPAILSFQAATIRYAEHTFAQIKPAEVSKERRKVIATLRDEVSKTFIEQLTIMTDDAYSAANKTIVADALATYAPALAATLPASARQQLATAFRGARTTIDQSLLPQLDKIGNVLGNTACDGLCRF